MDHLINKEICRTTKPEKSAKLTIDNAQLSSNGGIGMNMRDTSHANTCILWLRTFIKDITRYTLRTFASQLDPRSYKKSLQKYNLTHKMSLGTCWCEVPKVQSCYLNN
jgi:hypothetical protein